MTDERIPILVQMLDSLEGWADWLAQQPWGETAANIPGNDLHYRLGKAIKATKILIAVLQERGKRRN